VRLTLAYDGTEFHGFQRQPGVPTIQAAIEAKLQRVTGETITVTGAGRTDAGVHATGQVIHFRTAGSIPTDRLAVALNSLPPFAIVAREPRVVPDAFHARFDASGRAYRYLLLDGEPSPFLRRYTHRVAALGDLGRLSEAARHLVGRHDFASFCAAGAEVAHTVRHVTEVALRRSGAVVVVEIAADGFLHSMVRIVVGTLLEVAAGRREPEEVRAILAARDRTAAGPTAPARGLFLTRVTYPETGETHEDVHGEAG
jgi:tRNA pseudouridine38-40 synthase